MMRRLRELTWREWGHLLNPPSSWWVIMGVLTILSIATGTTERPVWANLAILWGLLYGYYIILLGFAVLRFVLVRGPK